MTIQEIGKRLSGRTPGLLDVTRHYAVLVPLVDWQGETCLLLEVRARTLHRQPGEVCFPGGRMEPGESPAQCAIRETGEELSISAGAIHTLAPLDSISHPEGFAIHPILAGLDSGAVARLQPAPAEVQEVFYVPLAYFQAHPPTVYQYSLTPQVEAGFPYEQIGFPGGYPWRNGQVEVPVYLYQGRAVWGLTGRIVRHLVACLDGAGSNR